VRAYAAMPATKAFIQQFLTRANVHTIGKKAAEPEVSIAPGVSSKGIAASTASSKGGARRPTAGGATPTRRKSAVGIPPIATAARYAQACLPKELLRRIYGRFKHLVAFLLWSAFKVALHSFFLFHLHPAWRRCRRT
jgi:hypothetical protein